MQLSECRIGQLVTGKKSSICEPLGVGHIARLGQNDFGECVLRVIWQNGDESLVHPSNLEKLK